MSTHLVACAATLPLKPSEKLALLCLAENANSKDGIAFPGMKVLQTWTGLSPSRVQELLNRLMEYELIAQVAAGHKSRAAEFVVFPHGCCTTHGKPEASDGPEAIDDRKPPADVRLSGDDQACGHSGTSEALGAKASSFEFQSLQFSTSKASSPSETHQVLPPKEQPPVVTYQHQPAERAPATVRDLNAYRHSRFDTGADRTPHIGHAMYVLTADPPTLICESCSTVLSIAPALLAEETG